MREVLESLLRLARILRGAQWWFHSPKRASHISFDLWPEHLQYCVPIPPDNQLRVRNEALYMNLRTLILSVKWFWKLKTLKLSYLAAVLSQIKPDLCITYIDNNELFHRLSNYFEDVKFVAVQNSWRFPTQWILPFSPNRSYRSHYLCFGAIDQKGLEHDGVAFASCKIVGNTKSKLLCLDTTLGSYDIVFISQGVDPIIVHQVKTELESSNNMNSIEKGLSELACVTGDQRYDEHASFVTKNMDSLLRDYSTAIAYFVRFIRKTGKTAAVLARGVSTNSFEKQELLFWQELEVEIAKTELDSHSKKTRFPQGSIFLGGMSTLALDLLGITPNVSIPLTTSSKKMIPSGAEKCFFQVSNYEEFEQKLLRFLSGFPSNGVLLAQPDLWVENAIYSVDAPYTLIKAFVDDLLMPDHKSGR